MVYLDSNKIAEIKNLTVRKKKNEEIILKNISIDFSFSKNHFIIGQSGSGKSTLAYLLFGIFDQELEITYDQFDLFGKDFQAYTKDEWKFIRGNKIVLIPQNPAISLHPYLSIGSQLMEFFKIKRKEFAEKKKLLEFINMVGILKPIEKWNARPTQLSGGEKQRILIVMAIYSNAKVIVCDEPTTSLDPYNEKKILKILLEMCGLEKKTMIFITHDNRITNSIADIVTVIKNGEFVETVLKNELGLINPINHYSRELLLPKN